MTSLLRAAASIALLGPALASEAPAQARPSSAPADAPAAASTEQTETQQDIIVVADRSSQSAIDRTTYLVKDNAEARASSALDLLGRVPSVDVSPSGQLRLIGRGGVTIQVDGQEVPNANAFLRAMQGSQVAKIEVVTNPSAQFSARGTGGIINIITRRRSDAGLGGSMTAGAGRFGSYEGRASPSWTSGKLSLNGSIGIRREGAKSESEDERAGVEPGGEADRVEAEESQGDTDSLNVSFGGMLQIAPRQTVSITALGVESEGRRSAESDVVEEGEPSQERQSVSSDARMRRIAADYRHEGSRPGGQTSLSVSHTLLRFGARRRFVTESADAQSLFGIRSELSGSNTIVKLDQFRPAGERRLSIGGQFEKNAENNRQAIASSADGPIAPEESFEGAWSEAAAYVSYQFPFGGTSILAGARLESRWFDIADVADDPRQVTRLFPSLHVERSLSPWLKANLSYSRRIGWHNLALLDPRLRYSDPVTARAGNPLLRPEKTDSLELKLMAKAGNHQADLSSYYQRTCDLRSDLAELEGDVLVSRPVNLGRRTTVGTSLNLRGPLAKGLRYTVTADLGHEEIDEAELPGIDDGGARYGASFQLDYRDGIEGRAGSDEIRLTARYTGPVESGLARISSIMRADASWSHAITDRLSTVLTASHAFSSTRATVFGPEVISRTSFRADGPSFNLALTYGLSPSGR